MVFLKIIFQKEEQEEKYGIEKEILEKIELLHQQAMPKILVKQSVRNKYICTYYIIDR